MKFSSQLLAAGLFAALLCASARADWPSPKYVQLPDLTPNGMDISATWKAADASPYTKILADDFICTSQNAIEDIHIWGSWLNDMIDPTVQFKLSIHADVPRSPTGAFSRPGDQLWSMTFSPGEYKVALAAHAAEQFFEPGTQDIIGRDTTVFQYNFSIPREKAFVQQGTNSDPLIYWLDVQAILPETSTAAFGWKTSIEHFNDGAVFGDTATAGGTATSWSELLYPQNLAVDSSLWGKPMDMAFVITPEPSSLGLLALGALGLIRRRR